jgi:hypothetical protein
LVEHDTGKESKDSKDSRGHRFGWKFHRLTPPLENFLSPVPILWHSIEFSLMCLIFESNGYAILASHPRKTGWALNYSTRERKV